MQGVDNPPKDKEVNSPRQRDQRTAIYPWFVYNGQTIYSEHRNQPRSASLTIAVKTGGVLPDAERIPRYVEYEDQAKERKPAPRYVGRDDQNRIDDDQKYVDCEPKPAIQGLFLSLKDHYLDDIALQTYVLRGAGVAISSIELLHVNTKYVRGPNGICWTDFFMRLDVGDAVAARLIDLPARLPAMRDCLSMIRLPDAEPGIQCGTPYECEFWDRCTAGKPADWIAYFPRLSQARANELKAHGIESISSTPADFPLTSKQAIIRDATASGKPYIATDLGRLLHAFGPPACYLDFEAMMPPIPLYEGTRPYQTIPFQWSLHTIDRDGTLNHKEFLADGVNDPRRQFAETLIDALACSDDPIIVYSAYEQTRLTELAADFSDLSTALNAVIARLADLLPIVRSAIYLPEFGFSNSIKSVAPALCPGFSYDDLDGVADGGAASAAFLQLASDHITNPGEASHDTLAMVEVHRALARLVAAPSE